MRITTLMPRGPTHVGDEGGRTILKRTRPGRGRFARKGFTLVELMIAVAIMGLLMAIAVPNFLKARARAQHQTCLENLFQIESAKQIWGVEKGKKDGDIPVDADLIGPTLYMKVKPICPASGEYDYKAIGTPATCDSPGHIL